MDEKFNNRLAAIGAVLTVSQVRVTDGQTDTVIR